MSYSLPTLRGDVLGGITATVVSLPVVIAYGAASGLGPAAGLYGAVAIGFFAAALGGTRALISSPTTSMTVATIVIIANHAANLTEALTVIVMSGLVQVLLGLLRIGRLVAYTPYVVISGFTSGIGVILVLTQVAPFFGTPMSGGGPLGALRALPETLSHVNAGALAIAVTTLAIGVLWPRALARRMPSPIAALVAGTLMGVLWLHDAPVVGPLPAGLPELRLTLPSAAVLANAVQPAVVLALFGSMRTLLASLFADSLTGARHDPDRELVAQGIGNMAAGLVGGIPGAGTTKTTAANIRAGGRTSVSGVLRAAFLLALLLGLGPLVAPIPHAALAGILVKTGWSVIDWRLLARMHRIRREHLLVMLTTLGLTVFVDLITAVVVGLIAASLANAQQMEDMELESVVSVPLLDRTFFRGFPGMAAVDPHSARVGLVALRGRFTVASSRELATVIGADIRDHEVVVFDFSGATYLDDSAAMVIDQLLDTAEATQTGIVVAGLSGSVANTLGRFDLLRRVPAGQVVDTMDDARQAAADLLDG